MAENKYPKINANARPGFTLIELMVVISIITLIASVILTDVRSARQQGKDAAIKEEVDEYVKLMAFNYDEYNSYCDLSSYAWINASGQTCSTLYSGDYASQAQAICASIYNNANDIWLPVGGYRIFIHSWLSCNNYFSIMVALNDGNWYCAGSSGAKGEYSSYDGQPGCWDNP